MPQVNDNGEGIPPENLCRVGERNWTTRDQRSPLPPTTGSSGEQQTTRSGPALKSKRRCGDVGLPKGTRFTYGVAGEFLASLRH
jgi:hypothetical protein